MWPLSEKSVQFDFISQSQGKAEVVTWANITSLPRAEVNNKMTIKIETKFIFENKYNNNVNMSTPTKFWFSIHGYLNLPQEAHSIFAKQQKCKNGNSSKVYWLSMSSFTKSSNAIFTMLSKVCC